MSYAATYNPTFQQAMQDRTAKLISNYLKEERLHKKIMTVIDNVKVVEFTVVFVMRLFEERILFSLSKLEAEVRCAKALEDRRDIFLDLSWCDRKEFGLPESLAIAEKNLRDEQKKVEATKRHIEDIDKLIYSLFPGNDHLTTEEIIDEAIEAAGNIAVTIEASELRENVKEVTSSSPNREDVLDLLGLGS